MGTLTMPETMIVAVEPGVPIRSVPLARIPELAAA